MDDELEVADAVTVVGSDPGEGVGDAEANPLEGDSDNTDDDGAGDTVRCRYEVDLAIVRPGGGVAVDGRSGLLPATSDGEVRTDVEKAGLSRPFRN